MLLRGKLFVKCVVPLDDKSFKSWSSGEKLVYSVMCLVDFLPVIQFIYRFFRPSSAKPLEKYFGAAEAEAWFSMMKCKGSPRGRIFIRCKVYSDRQTCRRLDAVSRRNLLFKGLKDAKLFFKSLG